MTRRRCLTRGLTLGLLWTLASCGGKTVSYESEGTEPEEGYVSQAAPGSGGAAQGGLMVAVPEGFLIDSSEVTQRQYAAFIAAQPRTDAQPGSCSWNASFEPEPGCLSLSAVCQGNKCADHPQVCVDWCDARAYCAWAGKRLCGDIDGGPADYDDIENAATNQWYHVCTSGGANVFAYGNSPDARLCNTHGNPVTGCDAGQGGSGGGVLGACTTTAVGSLPACQSNIDAYSGVYDMTGNVWEWEDACEGGGPQDNCRVRGGSFYYGAYDRCGEGGGSGQPRSATGVDIGFRCCSD